MAASKSNESDKKVAVKVGKGDKSTRVATSKRKSPKETESRAHGAFEEMDVLFDRLSRGLMTRMGFPALGEIGWPFQTNAPKVDVIDRDNEILVRAELPGMSKDDLDVSLTDRAVTIRGETHKETTEEEGDYFRREISSGSFQRTVSLPAEVAGDRAKATFQDGVLELLMPKTKQSSKRKLRIED